MKKTIDKLIRYGNRNKRSSIIFNILFPFFSTLVISIIFYKIGTDLFSMKTIETQALINTPVFLFLLYVYLRTNKIVYEESGNDLKIINLFFLIALGLSVSVFLNILLEQISLYFNIHEENMITEAVLHSNKYFALFLTCISAPLCEELVYRGYIFKTLNRFHGFWVSAIISSLLFGIAHIYFLGIIYAFLCGIILSYIYYVYRSLVMCMILHMSINFFTLTVFYNEIEKLSPGQILFAEFIAFILIIMITLRMYISDTK